METKPTQTTPAAVAAREFIPNINTANEEIVRLDGSLATANANLLKAQDDLKAANDLLAGAPKPADLQAAKDAQKVAEDALSAATTANATEVKRLQGLVDAAKTNGVKAAAAAGVPAVDDPKTTGIDAADDKAKHSNLTGLQRAIAGNIDLQSAKSGK